MITQCPLAHGGTQLYRFNLTQAGTYWYHSHFKSQYTAGLFGPLIVHAATEAYDYFGEATIVLSDWYHRSHNENEEWYLSQEAFGQPPMIDSTLMNGMGLYACSVAFQQGLTCRSRQQFRPVIKIQKGETYRLRVINAASRSEFDFSIDDLELNVIEADGIYVVGPVPTQIAPISPGQRYSFLVRCPEDAKNGSRYIIRGGSSSGGLQLPGMENINQFADFAYTNVTGVLECTGEDLSELPGKSETTKELYTWLTDVLVQLKSGGGPGGPDEPLKKKSVKLNQMDLPPFDGIPAPEIVDEEYTIYLTFIERVEDDVREPTINFTAFTYPEDKPLLHKVIAGEPLQDDMIRVDIQHGNVIQLIINNEFAGPHPFHLHGHHFWIVGMGEDFEGSYDPEIHNLTRNGVKRDTLFVPDMSWAAIRFIADNPGVWLAHCHQDWHAVGGMAMVFVEGLDIIREEVEPTDESLRVCGLLNSSKNNKIINNDHTNGNYFI